MSRTASVALGAALILLGGCVRAGNVKTAKDFDPPPAPPVAKPHYDPFAPYGSAPAIWTPRAWDSNGTLVNPSPRGNHAPGFRRPLRPPGTF